ncbi:MAG: M23 family metallopeptidase [Polaromonas sp.]|nr:M23 family metallopeptidase [Polaromonas sp.]
MLAPCTGQVVIAVDGLPDMRVPEVDRDHLAGNHVMLRCAEADVLLGHMQPGSVRVHAGDNVAVGDWLGSVGNSGNTGEPHLHVHAQGRGPTEAPLGGDPRPIQFNGRFPVRGDRIEAP